MVQAQVIPEPGSLIGDLLSMDIGGTAAPPPGPPAPLADLLGGGLDQLLGGPVPDTAQGEDLLYPLSRFRFMGQVIFNSDRF